VHGSRPQRGEGAALWALAPLALEQSMLEACRALAQSAGCAPAVNAADALMTWPFRHRTCLAEPPVQGDALFHSAGALGDGHIHLTEDNKRRERHIEFDRRCVALKVRRFSPCRHFPTDFQVWRRIVTSAPNSQNSNETPHPLPNVADEIQSDRRTLLVLENPSHPVLRQRFTKGLARLAF
jgi:hypothetical protein